MRLLDGAGALGAEAGPHLRAMLRSGGRRLADFAFPPQHLDVADGPRPLAGGLTGGAWAKVAFLEAPWCDGCGTPFEHHQGEGALCGGCAGAEQAYGRARAACFYDEHSRELILQLKHADRTELARLFAFWLERAAAELLETAEAILPVPLHPGRLPGRRYNQAAEIARPLARRAGLPYRPDALVRTRSGTQGGKSARGRRVSVRGAFAVPDRRRALIEGRRVLLIDDVMTTGATAEACARALLKAGAAAVDVAVVARVRER
jgi:ComF family protein